MLPDEFQPTFTALTKTFVENTYSASSLILEYGSGGSTLLAARANKTIITVESDKAWLQALMKNADSANIAERIIPIFASIGATENWGYPDDDSKWRSWIDYPVLPWRYCQDKHIAPDLVLIDGRFRVASFIASCVYTTTPIKLLFDDYADREHYHVVERFVKPEKIIENRMAVFTIEPQRLKAGDVLDMFAYFQKPD